MFLSKFQLLLASPRVYIQPDMFINNYRQINTPQGWRRRTRVQEERVRPAFPHAAGRPNTPIPTRPSTSEGSEDTYNLLPATLRDRGIFPTAYEGRQDGLTRRERQRRPSGQRPRPKTAKDNDAEDAEDGEYAARLVNGHAR